MPDTDGKSRNHQKDPRALVAEIYGHILELRRAGVEPALVVMNLADFKQLAWYRGILGQAESANMEYLGEYQLFGLPVYCENVESPEVRPAQPSELL